jgi:hypothetical protein
MNLDDLKQRIPLLELAQQFTSLKRVAASGGGEWAGPCPFCGGKDRFRVQPHAVDGGRWLCRHCSGGRWQDAISFGQRLWPAMPFLQVCQRLAEIGGLGEMAPGRLRARTPQPRPSQPAYLPPAEQWQASARQAIQVCAENLWRAGGEAAREYLYSRRLENETLQRWQVGYSPGAYFGTLWVPRGVLLPCVVAGAVWYLKVALLPGEAVRCQGCRRKTLSRRPCAHCGAQNKYRGVKGNRPAAIYGADDLSGAWGVLFVEGEMDALTAWQELQDVVAVCTLGSAANRPDLATWGVYLLGVESIFAVYDSDEAGARGLEGLQEVAEKVHPLRLPAPAKDVNDFYLQGGALWPWFRGELQRLGLA